MTKIEIQRVQAPTEKQLEKNIYGQCNLLVLSDSGAPICYLNNIAIRLNSKQNTKFLAPPGYKYESPDGTKHMNYFSLFPLGNDATQHESQKEALRALTAQVIQYAENGGFRSEQKPSSDPSVATSSPAPAKAKGAADPW